jgi:hypothetical protein
MRRLAVLLTLPLLTASACGGDDDPVSRATFEQTCQSARDRACERGWECDSFFAKAKYNSVAHCKSEARQELSTMGQALDAHQLSSCADVCQVMQRDVEGAACEDFDAMTFNTYRCGN